MRRVPADGVRWRFAAEAAEAPFQTAYIHVCPYPGAFNSVAQCCSLAVLASRRSRSCFSSSSVGDKSASLRRRLAGLRSCIKSSRGGPV